MAPWKLPLIVAAIAIPIVAGFFVGGGAGLGVGAAVALAVGDRSPPRRPGTKSVTC